jgi:hypothetical protein
MQKKRDHAVSNAYIRCPHCGRRVETDAIVRIAPGTARTLSAEPGELTSCECGSILEYHGRPGKLTVRFAPPERVAAFRELERERPAPPRFSSVVEYVRTFRSMPHGKPAAFLGTARTLRP